MSTTPDPAGVFDARVADLTHHTDVQRGTGFGSNPGLRTDGRIFAVLVGDDLVVKLPRERCEELLAAERVLPFHVGARRMREWIRVPLDSETDWGPLAHQARRFVRDQPSRRAPARGETAAKPTPRGRR